MLPALEFYNGVQMAADSLKQEGIVATIEIIDSKKANAIQQVYREYNPVKPQMVIGVMQNAAELKQASELALAKKIPFISATYPNDGGISSNPSLVILNSTLKTHCMALYNYLQKNYRSGNIVLCVRKGSADDRIKNYLIEAQKLTEGEKLKWKIASLPDSFTVTQLAVYLDSNKTNTVIGASLDKNFSLHVIEHLSELKSDYNSSIFGMPTWDELPLQKKEYQGIDVYYSTPFVSFSGNAAAYSAITKKFKTVANSKPSDMVFKGFEITYRYIKTLYENPESFWENVNNPKYKLFADFNIEMVAAKAHESSLIKYWENNKIYFVKKTDGAIKGVY